MAKIADLRKDIDQIDQEIMTLIEKRLMIVKEISYIKRDQNLPILDENREANILAKTHTYSFPEQISSIYQTILTESKNYAHKLLDEATYLIGGNLSYSYSKLIHEEFNNDNYHLLCLDLDEAISFIKSKRYLALNITNPYKKIAYQLVDNKTENVIKTKVINSIFYNKLTNTLQGDNLDYDAFIALLSYYNLNLSNEVVLIVGNGATSETVKAVLLTKKVKVLTSLVRTIRNEQEDLITNYLNYNEATVIINTTSYGTTTIQPNWLFPLNSFNKLHSFIDVNYQVLRLNIDNKKVRYYNGLYMLIKQALYFEEYLQNKKINTDILPIMNKIRYHQLNIVLIGLPLSGKTTLANLLQASLLSDFTLFSTDDILEKNHHDLKTLLAIGETLTIYRDYEETIINHMANLNHAIIDTGGGIIERENNLNLLRQNGLIIYLNPPLDIIKGRYSKINKMNRPLLKDASSIDELYNVRHKLYLEASDLVITTIDENQIIKEIEGKIYDYLNH